MINAPSSEYVHRTMSSLGIYKGSAFVTGGTSPITEILDFSSQKWLRVSDFPIILPSGLVNHMTGILPFKIIYPLSIPFFSGIPFQTMAQDQPRTLFLFLAAGMAMIFYQI